MTGHNATSYSDIQSYGRCPASYRWRNVVRIQRKRKNPQLRQGTIIHAGLRELFLALRDGHSIEDATALMLIWFDNEHDNVLANNPLLFADEIEEVHEMLNDSADIIQRYIDSEYEEIMTWDILHVEEEFIMFVGNEVVSFTPDLIIRDMNGYVWIVDHKSTSSVPTGGVPFADLQTLVYFAGVKDLYPELRGFIFSYLRKATPTLPRLNKTHNTESKAFGHYFVNNLKSIDTTYEILLSFLEETAPILLQEHSHQLRLAELRENNRFFFQEKILVSDETVAVVLGDVSQALLNMQYARENDCYPRVFARSGVQSCDRCEFQRICQAQLLGWNEELVLEEEYEPREPKNEYESEEE